MNEAAAALRRLSAPSFGEFDMYAFEYHRPADALRRRRRSRERRRQGARRRHDAAADDEAAAGLARRAHRSQERSPSSPASPAKATALVIGAMTPPRRRRRSSVVQAAIPALAELAGGIGDPACAQMRHDRRFARQQRSGRRLSRGRAGAWRDDRHQQTPHRRAGFFQGPVRDGARGRRNHHPGQLPDPAESRLHEIPQSRPRATRWSACSSPRRRAASGSR